MSVRAANSPASWGIEPPNPLQDPPWQRVLDETAAAGYRGTELGPLGYLPREPAELVDALEERGLALAAGFMMEPLSARRPGAEIDAVARATCASLQAGGAQNLILMDAIDPDRSASAGRSDSAERLDRGDWARLTDALRRVAAIATGEFGLRVSFHSHAGTHVEFEDEIERVLTDLEPAELGLCVDTGHYTYAGIDPVAMLRRHGDRVAYLHLKDLDDRRLADAIANRTTFERAVADGIFRPLGDGCVDFAGVREVLDTLGYDGWVTVEQDRLPDSSATPLEEARQSLAFLEQAGLV
jgi:inosose dehydratase